MKLKDAQTEYLNKAWDLVFKSLCELNLAIHNPPKPLLEYSIADYHELVRTAQRLNCAILAIERIQYGEPLPNR